MYNVFNIHIYIYILWKRIKIKVMREYFETKNMFCEQFCNLNLNKLLESCQS